jgi:hypothetical protein
MTTLLDGPATRASADISPGADTPTDTAPAERLRTTTAAMRLSFTWFGTRKTLSPQQKAQAARSFGAEGESLSAGKKLLDLRHPKFRAVTGVKSRAVSYFKGVSLPFPEPGVRLIRQDDVGAVNVQMTTLTGGSPRSRCRAGAALRRAEGHGPRAAGRSLQRGRLPGHARGPLRHGLGFSLR